jgi:hypothetical protein
MTGTPKDLPSELVPADLQDDISAAQITAFVGSILSGLEPMAKQQAQVQLAQIEAQRERDGRAYNFARINLFTGAAILVVIVVLLASGAAYLLTSNHVEEGLRVIWFGLGALGGFGLGRVGRQTQ